MSATRMRRPARGPDSTAPLASETRAVFRGALPRLLLHASIAENERALAAVELARRPASTERHAGAETDAAAAAENTERRKERRAVRGADAFRHPGVDVPA